MMGLQQLTNANAQAVRDFRERRDLTSPEILNKAVEVSERVLKNHAIQPHFRRDGDQIRDLLREAVILALREVDNSTPSVRN